MIKKNFYITGKKGFHITFKNGWTVSIQFGPGNYCDNYDMNIYDSEKAGEQGSTTAECAMWAKNGELFAYPAWGGDTVSNRSTPEEVLKYLNWASNQ